MNRPTGHACHTPKQGNEGALALQAEHRVARGAGHVSEALGRGLQAGLRPAHPTALKYGLGTKQCNGLDGDAVGAGGRGGNHVLSVKGAPGPYRDGQFQAVETAHFTANYLGHHQF